MRGLGCELPRKVEPENWLTEVVCERSSRAKWKRKTGC